jgi:hypothetical protein
MGQLLTAKTRFTEALEVLEQERPHHLILCMALNGYGMLLLNGGGENGAPYITRAQHLTEELGGGRRPFILREWAGAAPPQLHATMRAAPPAAQ